MNVTSGVTLRGQKEVDAHQATLNLCAVVWTTLSSTLDNSLTDPGITIFLNGFIVRVF